jgi:hypothetical protein
MPNIALVIHFYVVIFKAYILIWAPSGRFHLGFLIKIVCDFSFARCEGECLAKETVTGGVRVLHDSVTCRRF